jgi:hypothetical protein
VLDTNALLVPYGVGKTSLDDIGTRYRDLIKADRLIVPAHVAREFAHQRAEKIKNVFSALSKARSQSRERTDYTVLMQMAEYADLAKAETVVTDAIAARDQVLDKMLGRIRSWRWDDPVSELYRGLFTAQAVIDSDMAADKARPAVVDEVRVQEVLSRSDRPKHHWGFQAETAVGRWLVKKGYTLEARQRFPDFIARRKGIPIGVEVKLATATPLWSKKMTDVVAQSSSSPGYDRRLVVFVALDKRHAEMAYSSVGDTFWQDTRDRPIEVHVGFLGEDGEFQSLDV